jgi:hypothetical protein
MRPSEQILQPFAGTELLLARELARHEMPFYNRPLARRYCRAKRVTLPCNGTIVFRPSRRYCAAHLTRVNFGIETQAFSPEFRDNSRLGGCSCMSSASLLVRPLSA